MKLENTKQIGNMIRILRVRKNMSRTELSEHVGISESYLNKIEVGIRRPGFSTYQKMMEVLEVDFAIVSDESTIQGKCAARASEIMLQSDEKLARRLLELLEFISTRWIPVP